MADTGKKQIQVKRKISPFMAAKGKKAPAYLAAFPGLEKTLDNMSINVDRKVEVDPRKWKQSDLVFEAAACAKVNLAIFATKLGQYEKKLISELPKAPGRGAKEWAAIGKNPGKEASKLKKIADGIKGDWQRISKEIADQIELRYDDIEADKGDNKKAIAAGKAAIAKFDQLNTSTMFAMPVSDLAGALKDFSTDLSRSNADVEAAKAKALKRVEMAEKSYDNTAKEVSNVLKFMDDTGKKLAKDKNANPALQEVGKLVVKESGKLDPLGDSIDKLGKDIEAAKKVLEAKEPKGSDARTLAGKIEGNGSGYAKTLKDAIGTVRIIARKFNDALKEVKA